MHELLLFCLLFQSLSWVLLFYAPMDCSLPGSSVMGFSRQEYWSGLPLPPPVYLPDLEIELVSPALAGGFFTAEPPRKSWIVIVANKYESFHFIFSFLRSSVSNMYNIYSVFYSIRQYWCAWWHTDDSVCKQLTYTYSIHNTVHKCTFSSLWFSS